MGSRVIFLADMESFYASVETSHNPSLRGKPVAVCGDPTLRHGIILAASREAKAFGIKTGQPAWEARRMCPWIVFVHPRMQIYIDYSLRITRIFEQFTDRVLPYSIDEQFLDFTGLLNIFGSPKEIAATLNRRVWEDTGIRCRIGMGENLLQAKMACDCFAKKTSEAFFELNSANYAHYTWNLPIGSLFGVGHRMEKNFRRIGVRTIGHLAGLPREMLRRRWGVNGEVLWLNAHGTDYSSADAGALHEQKGIGHTATLPRDYWKQEEIELVLLEMTEEVCRRVRREAKMGTTVHLYCRGADFDCPSGFSRQKKLPEAAALAMEVYPTVLYLFRKHWDKKPLRAVGISLTGLTAYRQLQLKLSEYQQREETLTRAVDRVQERFGKTSIFRASSLNPGAQLFQRSGKIGGHDS
ncbi:MAG: DNA polymerase IV [Bacillota bacterium]